MFDTLFLTASWLAIPVMLVGFLPLIFGANWLVDSGSALAKRLNIPTLAIGLTIVAFGTSMPELIVNLFAASSGSTDIALGNIIGSNVFNILAILGVSAAIYPIVIKSSTTWIEIPLVVLAALVVAVLANDLFFDGASTNSIGRIDGLILLAFFVIFIGYTVSMAIKGSSDDSLEIKNWGLGVSIAFLFLGLAAMILGGKMIVEGAVQTARSFGMAERVIGLTIVSIGTSLPELATSAVAAFKKNSDIAIGNIVGSNLFNTFFILGATAVIRPIPLNPASNLDLWVNIGASVLLCLFVFLPRSRRLSKPEGWTFMACYVAYVAVLFIT